MGFICSVQHNDVDPGLFSLELLAAEHAHEADTLAVKIFIYGECHVAGTGAWCYAEALRDMSHEVFTFSDSDGLEAYGTNLLVRGYRKVRGRLVERHRTRHVARLVASVAKSKPEIVIIIKGSHIGPQDVEDLKNNGAWVVNINHDDFFSLNKNNWTLLQRSALPYYGYVFTTREVNVAEVKLFNSNVEFFPFAYYPRIHRPVDIAPSEARLWESDVSFVGTWEEQRCALLEKLVRKVPAKYAIWGAQWQNVSKKSPLSGFIRHKEVWMDELPKAIGGAKISLAFLRKQNRDDFTQRTFEIPACGGLLLAERTPRHLSFYKEGKEAEFFDPDQADELIAKVNALLKNATLRDSIRKAGRQALLRQNHTYQDRLERLLAIYEDVSQQQKMLDQQQVNENTSLANEPISAD